MAASLRVLVVEEHEIFRRGVVACLTDDPALEVVEATQLPPEPAHFDVAVVSPDAAEGLPLDCPLVVCGHPPASERHHSNRILATLPRSTLTPGQLLATVHAVAAGLRVELGGNGGGGRDGLDERSMRVLRLLSEGADTQQIASELCYSQRTIKGLVQRVLVQLGARTRAEAVAQGMRKGLI